MLLEVIVQTADDARAAEDGGAHRLEVVRDIRVGGLTPTMGSLDAIRKASSLPLRVMVRENAGFAIGAGELPVIRRTLRELAGRQVDGVVMGFARDGAIADGDLAAALADAPPVRVTYHRAFDTLREPLEGIRRLAGVVQVDRILTDGGPGSPLARSARLAALGQSVAACGANITVIAGGGVNEAALAVFVAAGCVAEAHVGRAAREALTAEGRVSATRVRRLRAIADGGR